MDLLTMTEAGKRMGVTGNSARRALVKAGVPLIRLSERMLLVNASDLAAFMQKRPKRGRPQKSVAAHDYSKPTPLELPA